MSKKKKRAWIVFGIGVGLGVFGSLWGLLLLIAAAIMFIKIMREEKREAKRYEL